tara:strand:- start:5773 stop:6471 length:699 start_codon:yes stop_codon:yes gene_type:complete
LDVQLNGKTMNKNNQTNNNFLKAVSTFFKDNLKALIISLAVIFLIFIGYQGYSYYNIDKLNNLSISYFKNIEIDDELISLSELESISKQNSFYSILSKLNLINKFIDKNEFDKSIELYNEILSSKDLDKNYISIVAIKGAYQFIDIVIKNNNNKYINDINNFISLIDENFDNYIGSKNELLYLSSILSLNDDSSYKNNSEILTLYENMMNNEKISSTIKERVKKIHEFYIFI